MPCINFSSCYNFYSVINFLDVVKEIYILGLCFNSLDTIFFYCVSVLVVDKEKHYILTVLRSVMQCFSAPFIKTSVESILQIMAPGDNVSIMSRDP